jgi:glutaredoxin
MTAKLTLYTRTDCCLCDAMKEIIKSVAVNMPLAIDEINVDSSPDLQTKFGSEVPVLFIDGRKAFKYRVTASELKKRLARKRWPLLPRLANAVTKKS